MGNTAYPMECRTLANSRNISKSSVNSNEEAKRRCIEVYLVCQEHTLKCKLSSLVLGKIELFILFLIRIDVFTFQFISILLVLWFTKEIWSSYNAFADNICCVVDPLSYSPPSDLNCGIVSYLPALSIYGRPSLWPFCSICRWIWWCRGRLLPTQDYRRANN